MLDAGQELPKVFFSVNRLVLSRGGLAGRRSEVDDVDLQERLETAVADRFGPRGNQRLFLLLGLSRNESFRYRNHDRADGGRSRLHRGGQREQRPDRNELSEPGDPHRTRYTPAAEWPGHAQWHPPRP